MGSYIPVAGDLTWTQPSDADIAFILATIRSMESGSPQGNYTAQSQGRNPDGSQVTASGAYQYVDRTWHNAALLVPAAAPYASGHAKDAPPAAQDAVAAKQVRDILAANGGRVSSVPIYWYWPIALNPTNDPKTHPDYMPNPNLPVAQTVGGHVSYAERWISRFHVLTKFGTSPHSSNPIDTLARATESVPILGPIISGVSGAISGAVSTLDLLKKLFDPAFLLRMLKVGAGVGAVFLGVSVIAFDKDTIMQAAKAAVVA